jgi:predicted ester cyclase
MLINGTIREVGWRSDVMTILIAHRLSTVMHAERIYGRRSNWRQTRWQGGWKSESESLLSARLEVYPDFDFHLEDVLWGVNSIVLYYANQKGTRTGEFMELSPTGKVARVVAHYSA